MAFNILSSTYRICALIWIHCYICVTLNSIAANTQAKNGYPLNNVLSQFSGNPRPNDFSASKNLTIEVLPSEEEDDGFLQFGILRDAYGYGDEIGGLEENRKPYF